jgi:mannose-1-phosphate guanylyltransferase
MTNPVYAVIMAGGSGTRFWPASRMDMPKQFIAIFGAKSLLEETIARVDAVVPQKQTLIVGSLSHRATIDGLLKGTQVRAIYEPLARNTAPCIGLAAAHIFKECPDALMIVLPADHFIGDVDSFKATDRKSVV